MAREIFMPWVICCVNWIVRALVRANRLLGPCKQSQVCGGQAGVEMEMGANCLGVLQIRGLLWTRGTIWGRKMGPRGQPFSSLFLSCGVRG